MPRRGGRSSVGRGSLWPPTRVTLSWLVAVGMVVGAAVGVFSSPSVGLSTLGGALVVHWLVWAYDQRWRRLQGEVFRRRAVAAWRRKLAWWMRLAAERVDPGARLRWAGSSFTIEKGIGQVWWTDGAKGPGPGCPLWYLERDYVLAHEQAERPV